MASDRRKTAYHRLVSTSSEADSPPSLDSLKEVAKALRSKKAIDVSVEEKVYECATGVEVLQCLSDALLLRQGVEVDAEFESALRSAGLVELADFFRGALDSKWADLKVVAKSGFLTRGYRTVFKTPFLQALRVQIAKEYKSHITANSASNVSSIPIDKITAHLEFRSLDGLKIDTYQTAVKRYLQFESAERKVMVIWGPPGQGKTTLVKKICHDWTQAVAGGVNANNEYISRIELLFVFSLRHLRTKVANIYDVFAQKREDLDLLEEWKKKNPKRVLVILDGFDELQPPTLCTELNAIFFKQDAATPPFNLIVTSCPFRARDVKHFFNADLCGLIDSEIPKFIGTCASSEENAMKILAFLADNPSLRERLFRCPLPLSMLCTLAEEGKELPKTHSGIYREICLHLWAKEAEKHASTFDGKLTDDELFLRLSRFAFEKTVCDNGSILFDETEMKNDFEIDVDRALEIGVLSSDTQVSTSSERIVAGKKSPPRLVSFIHSSFQEFFAACFAHENPEVLAKSIDQMEFKRFIPDRFLLLVGGLLVEGSPPLQKLLQAKMKFIMSGAIVDFKKREKRFKGVLFIRDQRYISFYPGNDFWTLLADLHWEIESEEVRDAALGSLLAKLDSMRVGYPLWLLNEMLRRNGRVERFSCPRWEISDVGATPTAGANFDVVVVSEPTKALLVSQVDQLTNRLQGIDFASISRPFDGVFYTGEAEAFTFFLRNLQASIGVKKTFQLTFRSKSSSEKSQNSSTSKSSSTTGGRVEILAGGRFEIIVEEHVDAEILSQIMEGISTSKTETLSIHVDSSCLQLKAGSSSQPRSTSTIWTTTNFEITALRFGDLRIASGAGLKMIVEAIEAEWIFLGDCAVSGQTFASVNWRSVENWKGVVFASCTSTTSSSILEEAALIVCSYPSVEYLFFYACDFWAVKGEDHGKLIEAFYSIMATGAQRLRFLYFDRCDIVGGDHEKLKDIGFRLPDLELVKVDDAVLYAK